MGSVGLQGGFPHPEAAEALEPYIKTRQEVEAIRDGLQRSFTLTPVDLAQPLTSSERLTEPAPLNGVRKAYWKALQAHKQAQARYDAIKAELAQTSTAHDAIEQVNAGFLTNSYIPLLRQREKQRRLEIIQRAYTRINAAGGATISESFESPALLGIGELPNPPTTTLAERDLGLDVDEHLVKLKKAVLSAKQQIDEHAIVNVKAAELAPIAKNPHAELRALQSAHSELTLWMEEQLAMISDAGGGAEGHGSATPPPPPPPDIRKADPVTMSDIEALYDLYLEARNRLLDTIEFPPPTSLRPVPMAFAEPGGSGAEPTDAEPRTNPSEAVLPYLEALVGLKQREHDLVQQGGYLRRQVAQSEEESRRVVARMADESHLVHPGASRARDWADAAARAGSSSTDSTAARIGAGKLHARSADDALRTIKGMPASLDAMARAGN